MTDFEVLPGKSFPLGAEVQSSGVNFCVFSRTANAVELLLFDHDSDKTPYRVIKLSPVTNRTFYYWHVFVPGIKSGQLYGYRVNGPFEPEFGHKFDHHKVLLDPYSKLTTTSVYNREAARKPFVSNEHCCMKSVVVDMNEYEWEGDTPLHDNYKRTVIYELHLKGFTAHPNSGLPEELRGTYRGLIEKIPYLKSLGITAVELLPVQQYDEHDIKPPLVNYWGYNPVSFFAPHRAYSSDKSVLGPVNEFRDMVKALHKAGIQVILDVVFNHSAEGDETGPTLSFRGFENSVYYMLNAENKSLYANFTGCGNTINANHTIVRNMIRACLQFWVSEMHIDGFRFDLASVLSRDSDGKPLENPPVLWAIESDPVLAGSKLIAEAWDAGGLYQVGSFIGYKWWEWNGKFRDDARKFVKSDSGLTSTIVQRLTGSRDMYPNDNRNPARFVNFITCHDGFTMNDLVSFNMKHNLSNNENNNDGANDNYSWNCGFEGFTTDPGIEKLRIKQLKNFFLLLLTAQGSPMLLMGDEVRRTQLGNNNAYCHDSEINWFNWNLIKENEELLKFVSNLIEFTQEKAIFNWCSSWKEGGPAGSSIIKWHGIKPGKPDFSFHSRTIAFELDDFVSKEHYYIGFNTYWEPLVFELPVLPNKKLWKRIIDTNLPSPLDFAVQGEEEVINSFYYNLQPRSGILLYSKIK